MRRRDQWIEWMRAVERESDAAAYAIELLNERLQRDPSSLAARGLERRNADHVKANREATYLIRLFAVFESGLREAWATVEKRTTDPKAADLLDALAARTKIPNDRLADAHRVRQYRNSVVHQTGATPQTVSLAEARRFLCRYFSFLPPDW